MLLLYSSTHSAPAPTGFDPQQAISHMLSSLEAECAAAATPGPATLGLPNARWKGDCQWLILTD